MHWQALDVDREAHARLKGHQPCVVWFTGLSGAGKSTIANLVEKRLHALGVHTTMLDGDNVRHGLNKDLGFTEQDRVENIRRVAEVVEAHGRRRTRRARVVHLAVPGRARDGARHWSARASSARCTSTRRSPSPRSATRRASTRKARRGELTNFTGIDSPYEPPEHPEVRIDTTDLEPDAAADQVVDELRAMGVITLETA